MKPILEIFVPQKTVNDDNVFVADLPFSSGERVDQGDIIASMETSKTTFNLYAPASGYLFYKIEEGDNLKVGQLFAIISEDSDFPEDFFMKSDEDVPESENSLNIISDKRISTKALALMKEHNISIDEFSNLTLIKTSDVLRVIKLKRNSDKPLPELSSDSLKPSTVLVGGGGLTKMAIELIQQTRNFHIVGIIDSLLPIGSEILEIPVIGDDSFETLNQIKSNGIKNAILCVGSPDSHSVRPKIYKRLKETGFNLPNLIHPSASVEESVLMGEGNLILANATVSSSVAIGNLCYINTGSIVSHDCRLGDNIHIAPGGILAGRVTVGDNSIIGMGATVYIDTQIGKDVIVRNGQNVFNHLSDNTVV